MSQSFSLEDAPDARFNLAAFLPVDLENDLIIQDQKQAIKPDCRDFKNDFEKIHRAKAFLEFLFKRTQKLFCIRG